MIHRLQVTCVSGPWLDDKCVRFIDFPDTGNLYDLHIAIQDSVGFDDEYDFYYFMGISHVSTGIMIPEGLEPEIYEIDTDIYEDIDAMKFLKPGSKESLYYVFMSEGDDWHFKIQATGKKIEPVDGELYPLVQESLSQGPNPEQYGSGFDDFAEDADHFRPMRTSGQGMDDADPFFDDLDDDDDFFERRFVDEADDFCCGSGYSDDDDD
ncbi:MAG: hypothetical protein GX804_08505 [Lentisphaerae bacterium]|nr:hypothetical protein [Lentisphaerota bacterium]